MNAFVKFMLTKAGGMYQNWMDKRATEAAFPENVEEFRDIPYLTDGKRYHLMDVYRPKKFSGKLPVIVDLHGGGLVLCTKEVNRPFCASLAERGYLVFCVDYPVVPEKNVPEILADVCAGMDAVDGLLDEYGGDRERVFLMGDSAGAFLSVYAVVAQKSEAIAKAAGIKPSGLTVKGLGLISGMFHTAECDETGVFLRGDFYGKDWRRHPLLPYLKPERAEVAGQMPPTFLVTGKADKLRPSTMRFHKGLQSAGVRCELLDHPADKRLPHDFVIMYPEIEESRRSLDKMEAFLCPEKTAIDK